jgi:hypothetical protein
MFSKYRELGLALIPLAKGQKNPIVKEWDRFSQALPTEAECDLWDRLWEQGHRNVGIVLGKASGVVFLDIDSDDPRILAAAPPSPVRKRGKKGESRAFKYRDGIELKHYPCLDILSNGSQSVLPPSIHPDTRQPYVWLTPDTLENFSVSDLPELDLGFLPEFLRVVGEVHPEKVKEACGHEGRNNRLKAMVWAKRIAQESEEEIVEAIYQYDLHRHEPRLFTDPKERNAASSEDEARMNAWRFVSSVTRTFIEKRAGTAPVRKVPEILVGVVSKPKAFEFKPYPEPRGTLGKLFHLCLDHGVREQRAIALGGAIAISSVILANRFKFRDSWPNVYVLNVAPTGAGKSFPQRLAKRILTQEIPQETLLGGGNYRSSSAFIKDLSRQRERLDIIDEASSLFGTISEGGVFQRDMDDIICELYSNSSDLFIGPESMGRESVRVWHPCISMLMSTTPNGLKESISNALATKGFFPRCFLFVDYEYGAQKPRVFDEELYAEVCARFRDIRANKRPEKGKGHDLINSVPDPEEIDCSADAHDLLDRQVYQWNEQLAEPHRSEVERVLLSRAGEQATKLALIHGALRVGKVEKTDVVWACEVLDAMRDNARHILPQLAAENRGQANQERVYALISEKGALTHKDLISRTRFLNKRERNDILESMAEEGRIVRMQDERGLIWSLPI